MARLAPTLKTLKALFARSGNQCAFPDCSQALVNHKNQFIGQLCHIETAMPGGSRYNERQTDEERRRYENLLLLCYPHHIETNDCDEFPVEKLREIKQAHESTHEASRFQLKEAELLKLVKEMEKFWARIERLNRVEHSMRNSHSRSTPKGLSLTSSAVSDTPSIRSKGCWIRCKSTMRNSLKNSDREQKLGNSQSRYSELANEGAD